MPGLIGKATSVAVFSLHAQIETEIFQDHSYTSNTFLWRTEFDDPGCLVCLLWEKAILCFCQFGLTHYKDSIWTHEALISIGLW